MTQRLTMEMYRKIKKWYNYYLNDSIISKVEKKPIRTIYVDKEMFDRVLGEVEYLWFERAMNPTESIFYKDNKNDPDPGEGD